MPRNTGTDLWTLTMPMGRWIKETPKLLSVSHLRLTKATQNIRIRSITQRDLRIRK